MSGEIALAAGACAAPAAAQGPGERLAALFEDGNHAERQSRRDRDSEGEKQSARIDRNLFEARQPRRAQPEDDFHDSDRESGAESAADQPQGEALSEHLAGDPSAAGAERRANREFMRAAFGSNQKQIRDVGAGDQQHGADRRHHDPEAFADIADQIVPQQPDIGAEARILEHLFADFSGRGDAVELDVDHPPEIGVRLIDRNPGTQPGDRVEIIASKPNAGAVESQWQDQIVAHVHKPEILWHHADDLARGSVNHDPAPDGFRIAAESALPVSIAEHDDFGAFVVIVFLDEIAAENRLRAENRKQAEGRDERFDALRIREFGDRSGHVACKRDVLKGRRMLPIGHIIAERSVQIRDLDPRSGLPYADQPLRFVKGKRPEQDAVDDAENSRVRADSQPQRDKPGQRKSRRSRETATRILQVTDRIHHWAIPPAHSSAGPIKRPLEDAKNPVVLALWEFAWKFATQCMYSEIGHKIEGSSKRISKEAPFSRFYLRRNCFRQTYTLRRRRRNQKSNLPERATNPRVHHAGISRINPGMNANYFYAGLSIFR